MGRRVLSGLLALALAGCAAVASELDKIPRFQMAPRLTYDGFSFARPRHMDWYMRKSEQDHTDVTLRRELFSSSDTHSFYVRVSHGGIERQPSSHEEFADLARSTGQQADYEIERLSYQQTLATRQECWCIRLESVDAVRGSPVAPDRELRMLMRGFRCLHPDLPMTTVDFFFSERGGADELDPKLQAAGEEFLEGVRIERRPSAPAS